MNDVDIILDLLKAMLHAKPDSAFIVSLHRQYCERGGLSKKQLEGLHSKASKVPGISISKLATLQAIINKRPTRYKSEAVIKNVLPVKDENTGNMLKAILEKYPQHKRVLFLQSKYDNKETLSPIEVTEIEKFYKLLL